jgi:hypothetical protein
MIPAQATGLGKIDKKQTSPVGATQIFRLEHIATSSICVYLRHLRMIIRFPDRAVFCPQISQIDADGRRAFS